MYKTAIYLRVSTKGQAEKGVSLELQEEKCHQWCYKHGFTFSEEHTYIDAGVSGALEYRDGFDSLKSAAIRKEFDFVTFYDSSRFSRDLRIKLNMLKTLTDCNVGFASASEEFLDSRNKNKEQVDLMINTFGSIAQYERSSIMRRTKQAKRHLYRKNLLHPGFIPYGYRKTKEKNTSNCVEVHPETSKMYKRIVDLYLYQGLSSNKIAHTFNEEKIPSPRYYHLSEKKKKEYAGQGKKLKWTDSRILKIIGNECYTGEKTYLLNEDQPVIFKYTPLVTKSDWAAMNRLRVGKIKLPKKAHQKASKGHFLIKEALGTKGFRCICGGPISKKIDNRRGNMLRRYYCQKKSFNVERRKDEGNERCTLPYFDADIIDNMIWDKICFYLSDSEEFEKLWRETPTIKPLRGEIDSLQYKLNNVLQRIELLILNLSETTDPDVREIISKNLSKFINKKDSIKRDLGFKTDQLKDVKASMDWKDAFFRNIDTAKNLRKEAPDGLLTKGTLSVSIPKLPIVGPAYEHLYNLPSERKKQILRQFINPVDGGKIELRLNKHGWEACDLTVRSTMKALECIVKSVGGDESFIQRLSTQTHNKNITLPLAFSASFKLSTHPTRVQGENIETRRWCIMDKQ